jgi:hypothetical protein
MALPAVRTLIWRFTLTSLASQTSQLRFNASKIFDREEVVSLPRRGLSFRQIAERMKEAATLGEEPRRWNPTSPERGGRHF